MTTSSHISSRPPTGGAVPPTGGAVPPTGGAVPQNGVGPAPVRAVLRRFAALGEDSAAWLATLFAYGLLSLIASLTEAYHHALAHPMLLFFFGLSLLTALLPAGGPRGQRITLLPGAGLAMALLLPPCTATLPVLLANSFYAATRDTPAARRGVLGRGAWLVLAALISGCIGRLMPYQPSASGHPGALLLAALVYATVYAAGRQTGIRRAGPRGSIWDRALLGGRLETAGLLASIPPAVLMAVVSPMFGLLGVVATAGLMALLLVIAAFGFEVGMLREQVRAMEKISAVTLSQTNPNRIIERFLQLSAGLVPCDRASLWLTDDSQTRLERVARRQSVAILRDPGDGDPATVRFGEGMVGRVADRQTPLIVRDSAPRPRSGPADGSPNTGSCALLLLPLVASGETIGVVRFERDAPGHYTPKDMTRLRSLASQVAATIANMRMHRDIYTQAVTDGLTGLYNRRHMQTSLIDERQRAFRYGHALSVIMLDVDGFKNYNDTYGHPQGDVLLKMLAGLLKESVREVDIVGRYGGEEFIILMPETSKELAARTAERLRHAVASTVFPGFADDPEMVVFKTISLGVATFPDDTDDIQSLVSQADQALYRAKRGGRNQVILADALAVLPEPASVA